MTCPLIITDFWHGPGPGTARPRYQSCNASHIKCRSWWALKLIPKIWFIAHCGNSHRLRIVCCVLSLGSCLIVRLTLSASLSPSPTISRSVYYGGALRLDPNVPIWQATVHWRFKNSHRDTHIVCISILLEVTLTGSGCICDEESARCHCHSRRRRRPAAFSIVVSRQPTAAWEIAELVCLPIWRDFILYKYRYGIHVHVPDIYIYYVAGVYFIRLSILYIDDNISAEKAWHPMSAVHHITQDV